MTLCLRTFASASVQMCLGACNALYERITQHKGKVFMKGKNDPVTTTDFYLQTMLTRGFKQHFPALKVVGEQSEEYIGSILQTFDSVDPDILPTSSQIRQQLSYKDLCLWMDPLDCTKGFIRGQMQNVTILMGLTYKRRPILGVIAAPFKQTKEQYSFTPTVTVGSVLEQQTYDYDGTTWKQKRAEKVASPLRMASSFTHNYLYRNGSMQGIMRRMGAVQVDGRGAGHKAMLVADGDADFMVMANSVTHKWDSCAGEAVIRSMGGVYTTAYNNQILYDEDRPDELNKQGLIASINREIHDRLVEAIREDRGL